MIDLRYGSAAAAALGCIALVFSGLALAQQTTVVGTIAGEFDVDAGGAATYSIPIALPPGAGGIAPEIGIAYNSQDGDDLLGVGFSVSGISQISRCPATLEQDGYWGAIGFDTKNRFSIDGERMVAVAGTYGGVQTEYRTEIESFSKIVSYGGTPGDPAYFKVWTRGGIVIELSGQIVRISSGSPTSPTSRPGRALSTSTS